MGHSGGTFMSRLCARYCVEVLAVILIAGSAVVPSFSHAATMLSYGDIVAADAGNGTLYRIDPVTGASSVISSGNNLYDPHGIVFDNNAQIVAVNDWNGPSQHGSVVRVNPATGGQSLIFYGADADDPWWPVVRPNGDILFTDYGNSTSTGGRLRRI